MEVMVKFTLLAALPTGKCPANHLLGGWANPRCGLDDLGKIQIFFTCREL